VDNLLCSVFILVESIWGIYSIPKAVPGLGRCVSVTKHGRAATTWPLTKLLGQMDLTSLVPPLLPLSICTRQGSDDLAPKWGRPVTFYVHLAGAWSYVASPVSGFLW
jgi:hypothetical protein